MSHLVYEFAQSNTSERVITLSNRRGEWFTAKLSGNVQVATEVSTYTDEFGLLEYFQKLGGYRKPWKGEIVWSSLEGDFKIAAITTSLGQVTFIIKLYGMAGSDEEWTLTAGISTELGQLPMLAKQAKQLFH